MNKQLFGEKLNELCKAGHMDVLAKLYNEGIKDGAARGYKKGLATGIIGTIVISGILKK